MAKDKLQYLYRYNVTQTEVLGADYPDFDLRGRACVWQPGRGIMLPHDALGDNAIPFGVIQRVFVTGKDPEKPLQEYQTKGRTVTVLQHGIMPDFLSGAQIFTGSLVLPAGIATGTNGSSAEEIANRGKWVVYPGLSQTIDSGQEARAFAQALRSWPFFVHTYTSTRGADERFVAYIH